MMTATVERKGIFFVQLLINEKYPASISKRDIPFDVKQGDLLILTGKPDCFEVQAKGMNASVDSIEDGIVHLELQNGEFVNIPIGAQGSIKEGDIVILKEDDIQVLKEGRIKEFKIICKNNREKEERLERMRRLRQMIEERKDSKKH